MYICALRVHDLPPEPTPDAATATQVFHNYHKLVFELDFRSSSNFLTALAACTSNSYYL
jgi:hypothetical protein